MLSPSTFPDGLCHQLALAELRSNFAPPRLWQSPPALERGMHLFFVGCCLLATGARSLWKAHFGATPASHQLKPIFFPSHYCPECVCLKSSSSESEQSRATPNPGPGPAPPTTGEGPDPCTGSMSTPRPTAAPPLLPLSAPSPTGTRAESISTPACPPLPPCGILSGSGTRWRPGNPRLSPTPASSFFCKEQQENK